MLLNIVSFGGHALNDSSYGAYFPKGAPMFVKASPSYAPRARTFPKLSYKNIGSSIIQFHVITKGTVHSQIDTLKTWFPVLDYNLQVFVVADAANSDKQWYLMGYAIDDLQVVDVGEYIVTLAVDEPLLRSVVVNEPSTWEVNSSGASKSLSVLGNWYARPIFEITISGAKTGGFSKRWWKPLYNPLTVANNEPYDWTRGGWDTAALVSDTTVSNQINSGGGISAGLLTIPIDTAVGGGLATGGGMCYVDTEQIYYTSISAGNMIVYDDGAGTTGRGWGGTTPATHADNAVLAKSHIMANGQDVRMFNGNTEIPRWLGGMNTSATKIWILPSFAPLISMTLDTAIAGSGTPATITVKKTAANLAMLKRLPPNFVVWIDSEVFFCSTPVPASYKFNVVGRTKKGTSIAAHASGALVRVLENDFTLAYGNPLAETIDQDDTRMPMLDLVNSTNTSWVFTELQSEDGLRSASWKSGITKRTSDDIEGNSHIYTATEDDVADPASVLGFAAKAFYKNAKWNAENFVGFISLYHPAGFTTVTVTGKKKRVSTYWGSFIFQKSLNGTTYANVFTEATPASAGAYVALSSHSGVSLSGNFPYIRWYGSAVVTGSVGNANYLETEGGIYPINSSNVLQSAFATSAEDAYGLDAVISLTETGESFRLRGPAKVGSVIVVNCDAETITLDGSEGGINITFNTSRDDWLNAPSSYQSSTCTLVYTETGVANVDIDVYWEDRMIPA